MDCGKAINAQRGEREPATAPLQSDESTIQTVSRNGGFYQGNREHNEVNKTILSRFAH
jgi:hypothetical protein